MKIQTFNNKKGMIFDKDPKRIGATTSGTLKIGSTEIKVSSSNDSVMPLLFHGGTGEYHATFTDIYGNVYDLGNITVQNGRIESPSQTAVEIMELRCRLDAKDRECESLRAEINALKNIFDTNSLNFLIK